MSPTRSETARTPQSGTALSETEFRKIIIAELAQILQIDIGLIDSSRRFDEYGLDSTDAVVVVGLIEERLGIELEPELLLRNETIDQVIADLLRQKILVAA